MEKRQNGTLLTSILEPVVRCLTPESARAIAALRADDAAQARIEELADKCTEGTLTPSERAEYEARIWGGQMIGILQAQARSMVEDAGTSDGR